MRKKVLLAALSALSLTACVNDETIEMNPGNAVAFRPSTENSTRANVTTSNTIQDFKVWGYYKASNSQPDDDYITFMDGQEVERSGSEWVYSPVRFWPSSGPVDFYSVSPADVTANITKEAKQIVDYTVETDPAQQTDLLYAVNMRCLRSGKDDGVPVNFRHALSQVVFKAKSTNKSIEVEIGSIKVSAMGKGTFTFPNETTTAINLSNTDTEDDETFGQWTLSTAGKVWNEYHIDLSASPKTVPSDGTTVDVTSATDGTALLLLPQELTTREITVTEGDYTYPDYVQPSIQIECKIYNIIGDEKIHVLGSVHGYSTIYVTLPEDTWQQGRKYTYTLIFGEEVTALQKISFTASVDEFQEITKDISTSRE